LELGQIRILKILPGSEGDVIQCCLWTVNIFPMPDYDAISYTWGDPRKPKASIVVNGHKLDVTENCVVAMLELRREGITCSTDRFIWIDAICINQEDIDERNQQVIFMLRIYQMAQNLIVWLGPEADESDKAIEIINEAVTHFSQSPSQFMGGAKALGHVQYSKSTRIALLASSHGHGSRGSGSSRSFRLTKRA
jgi:Heterokaryon incompatibility protein (HET)